MNLKRKYEDKHNIDNTNHTNQTNKKIHIQHNDRFDIENIDKTIGQAIEQISKQISIFDEHKTFEDICVEGNIPLIRSILQNKILWSDIDHHGFKKVCQFGHIEAANIFISYGATINLGLECAYQSRHIKMIQFLIPKYLSLSWRDEYASAFDIDCNSQFKHLMTMTITRQIQENVLNDLWAAGLYYAFKVNNVQLMELMLAQLNGDDFTSSSSKLRLIGSCEGKHKHLIDLYFDEPHENLQDHINDALNFASSHGRIDWLNCIRNTFLNTTRNYDIDYSYLIRNALENSHENAVDYLFKWSSLSSEEALDPRYLIHSSCESGNYNLWKYIINKLYLFRNNYIFNECLPEGLGFKPLLFDYMGNHQLDDLYEAMHPNSKNSKLLEIACVGGSLDIVKEILRLGFYDINNVSFKKIKSIEIVLYLIHHHANINIFTVNVWDEIILFMCKNGSIELLNLLIELKINNWKHQKFVSNAIENNQVTLAKLMIECGGADIEDDDGYAILKCICKINNFELLKLIYDKKGPSSLIKYMNRVGINCILVACKNNEIEFAKRLIKDGCSFKYEKSAKKIIHQIIYTCY